MGYDVNNNCDPYEFNIGAVRSNERNKWNIFYENSNTTFVVERSVFDTAVVRFETDRVGIRLVCLANESN